MPTATVDGIPTRYEVSGDGPPLLMFSPGGFDSTLENWTRHGLYPRIELMARLRERFTCVAFDRRESGRSGGRLERIRWDHWVVQGAGLLDHLGIQRAHLIGACVGCSTAAAFAVAHPGRTGRMVTAMGRLLFDRDTVCGVEPTDLMALDTPALIVPGQDASHAPSAARYLQECLARSDYWDVPVAEQTADNAPARVIEFLSQQ